MKESTETSYNYLDKYLTGIRTRGRYSFTLEELKSEFGLPYLTLKQNLYRLKSKNKIAQIRQGFYVIIPPEYSNQGTLPAYLFLDDLMRFLNRPYYLAMFSAAALYGAAHQQPMEYSVISKSPAPRSINNRQLKINFFSKRKLPQEGIVQRKTMAGYINVSSPELTALDLFDYADKLGVNRVVSILQELSQEIKPGLLKKTAMSFPVTAAIQRLGYILDKVLTEEKLADSLLKVLNLRTCFPVPLSSQKKKIGETDNKWKVIKNQEIEYEL